ncbi:MAG: hypothetical protein ACRBN8_38900 [Nannocystales bacterium]
MNEELEDIVARLLATHQPPLRPPWSPRDEVAVEAELRSVVRSLAADLRAELRAEFDHYGSGYASFIDAWFYRRESSFQRKPHAAHFTGLAVLLSRLAPVYCFLEGEKSWAPTGAASYLPTFESVDVLETDAVANLSHQVELRLERWGYNRLRTSDLAGLLTRGVAVPTLLSNGPYREFDALFHWED